MNIVDTNEASKIEIQFIQEDDAIKNIQNVSKRWSFFFVYHFSEIRDIYLALKESKATNLADFTDYCLKIELPYVSVPWNKEGKSVKGRRILEVLNALMNLSIIDSNYKILKEVFLFSKIGEEVSEEDLKTFRNIYFSYFRFKEIFSWFVSPPSNVNTELVNSIDEQIVKEQTFPLFFFSDGGRFTNNFFYKLEPNPDLYFIDKTNGKLLRFWDVFISWGKKLKVIEKFRIRYPEILTSTGKSIGCCYVLSGKTIADDFSLLDYISENYKINQIYLPELILKIALQNRISIESTQNLVIEQYKRHKNFLSLERTSEVFIKSGEFLDNDKILYPKYDDAYISHIIVRR